MQRTFIAIDIMLERKTSTEFVKTDLMSKDLMLLDMPDSIRV